MFGCQDFVECDGGRSEVGIYGGGSGYSGSTVSCKVACDGKCCVGPNDSDACTGFTGRVCKDGYSCTGLDACKDADIDLVVGGCRGDLDNGFDE